MSLFVEPFIFTSRLTLHLQSRFRDWLARERRGLFANRNYRRIFSASVLSAFGGSVAMVALPLTAALTLNATPLQMALLETFELLPFALLSLPAGALLDRVKRLPVMLIGEVIFALAVFSIPLAHWFGLLNFAVLYSAAFIVGCMHVIAGGAAQVVLVTAVGKENLLEAHSKNATAQAVSEIGGPGIAGMLVQWLTAPFALVVDALMAAAAALMLRGVTIVETVDEAVRVAPLWSNIKAGLKFCWRTPELRNSALIVGLWQILHHMSTVVIVLFATRELKLGAGAIGIIFTGIGVGSFAVSLRSESLVATRGVGGALTFAIFMSAIAWTIMAAAPTLPALGLAAMFLGMFAWGWSASLLFINFLSLRQSVTPESMLGRMTSTMRFLIIAATPLGSLLGGWIATHFGLRASLIVSAVGGFALWLFCRRSAFLRALHVLPSAAPAH